MDLKVRIPKRDPENSGTDVRKSTGKEGRSQKQKRDESKHNKRWRNRNVREQRKQTDSLWWKKEFHACPGGLLSGSSTAGPPAAFRKLLRGAPISSEVCVHVPANDKYGCVCIFHRKRNSGKQPDIPEQLIHACAGLRVCVCVGGRGGLRDQPSHVHSCCCNSHHAE